MQELLDVLHRLRSEGIHFSLEHIRDETIMVLVTVPGQRWEVEFFADGSTEIEVFTSGGVDTEAGLIEEMLERFGEGA